MITLKLAIALVLAASAIGLAIWSLIESHRAVKAAREAVFWAKEAKRLRMDYGALGGTLRGIDLRADAHVLGDHTC